MPNYHKFRFYVLGRTTPSRRGAGRAKGITNFETALNAGPAYLKASFHGFR